MSAILVLLVALALESRIEAEPLDAGRHLLAMEAKAHTTSEAAQAALAPTAGRLCGNRPFFWGAFQFAELSETPDEPTQTAQTSFQQELYCGNPETLSESAVAAAPGPSDAQQRAVLKATYGYLAAKDSDRLSQAYAMMSRRAKLITSEPDWIAKTRDFNEQVGAVRARRVTDISWYRDPPDAPEPGLYVAADLNGTFENAEFLCGYVVWKLDSDGRLRLVREEQNFVERRRGAKLAPLDRAPLRAQMGCRS